MLDFGLRMYYICNRNPDLDLGRRQWEEQRELLLFFCIV